MVEKLGVILTKEPKTGGSQCGCFQILKVILGKVARMALRAAQSRASLYTARDKGGRGTKCEHTLSVIRRAMSRTVPWDHSLETSLNKSTVWVPSPCPTHLLKTSPSGHQKKVSPYVDAALKIPPTPKLMGHTKQVSLMGAQAVFRSQHAPLAVC